MKRQSIFWLSLICVFVFYSCRKEINVRNEEDGNIKISGTTASENVTSVIALKDGGYAVCGETNGAFGETDIFLMLLDNYGNKKWQKNFGGKFFDHANGIAELHDGGLLIAGATTSFGSDTINHYNWKDMYLLRVDKNGTLLWQKTYCGTDGSWNDEFTGITPLGNDEFAVCGYASNKPLYYNPKACVYKINGRGDVLWRKNINSTSADFQQTKSFAITTDKTGNIIVSSMEWKANDINVNKSIFTRLSPDGTQITQTESDVKLEAKEIKVAEDGNIFICGSNGIFNDNKTQGIIAKYNAGGNIDWVNNYIGLGLAKINSFSLQKDELVAGGETFIENGNAYFYIIRSRLNGKIISQKTLGNKADQSINYISCVPNNYTIIGAASRQSASGKDVIYFETDSASAIK